VLHHVTPEPPRGSDDADPHRARRLARLGRISDPVPAWIDESALRCIETMDENRDSLGLHDLQDIDANAIGQGSLPRTGAADCSLARAQIDFAADVARGRVTGAAEVGVGRIRFAP